MATWMLLFLAIYLYLYIRLANFQRPVCRVSGSFFSARRNLLAVAGVFLLFFLYFFIRFSMGEKASAAGAAEGLLLTAASVGLAYLDFRRRGDGVFQEGVILHGFGCVWGRVSAYKLEPAPKSGKLLLTLQVEGFTGKTRPRRALVPAFQEEALRAALEDALCEKREKKES